MKINWFPGHMAKALKQMAEEINKVDMVIYVLDARAPVSCINPEFSAISKDKPVLYILNKSDLADDYATAYYKKYFAQKPFSDCVVLNSTMSGANRQVEPAMRELCRVKLEKYKQKGISVNLRAMVIGVPNSGKSTLINNLCGVKKTVTGDKPGVTKGKQWLALKNGFEILDTPGTLWPNLTNQDHAKALAFIGSIKNDVVDINDLSLELLKFLIENYKSFVCERYNIKIENSTPLEVLEDIAKSKHFVLKGGITDYDRACMLIIDDFRKGRIGKITLDLIK